MINACWAVLLGTILRRHFFIERGKSSPKSDLLSVGFFAERCNFLLKMKFMAW
jgi:hypothetical protein